MLAGEDGSPGLLVVQVVGRAQVDDIHAGVLADFLEGIVGARQPQSLCGRAAFGQVQAQDAVDLYAAAAQGFGMGAAHEAGSDNCCSG